MSMMPPARVTQALRKWAADGPRARYAEEVAAIYRGYRSGLEAAGLAAEPQPLWALVPPDARARYLRRAPAGYLREMVAWSRLTGGVAETVEGVAGFLTLTPTWLDALYVLLIQNLPLVS